MFPVGGVSRTQATKSILTNGHVARRVLTTSAILRTLIISIGTGVMLVILWIVVQEFFLPRTGDFDHEIYYGQRVALGELPWTDEYFDKLPAQQIFMALPSSLGGITAWRTISISICVWASLIVIRNMPKVLVRDLGLTTEQSNAASWLMVFGFFSILAIAPGGFTTINAVSASLMIVVSTKLFWHSFEPSGPRISTIAGLGTLAALAISFRPHFFLPFLFLVVMVGIGRIVPRPKNLGFAMILSTGAAGIVMNVGPYLLIGNLTPVREGLMAVAGATRPGFTPPAIAFLLTSLLLGLAGATLFLRVKSRIGFFFSGSTLALTVMILTQHFWNHYVVLYAWYFSGLATVLIYALLPKVRSLADVDSLSGTRKIAVLSAAVIVAIGSISFGVSNSDLEEQPESEYVSVVTELIETYGRDNISFLAPRDMHVHWLFSESRHGLPGGQALRPIREGMWVEKGEFESFLLPRNMTEYCEAILEAEVRFVIVRPYHFPEGCMGEAVDALFTVRQTTVRSKTDKPDLIVWERIS